MKSTSSPLTPCLSHAALLLAAAALVVAALLSPSPGYAQADDPSPPGEVVKLIFIHHSSGENWLRDDHGGLGRALGENNYFVSDTNYGWGPDAIGDRTDIPNWPEWFRGPDSQRYLAALFSESGQNSSYTRDLPDPGGENQVILFKSCFPNSNLEGNPGDPPAPGEGLAVGNAKYIYNDLLNYFATRPDKLFIVITAPPVQDPTFAANARAFNTWLVNDWLNENNYSLNNVAVFDYYNVLTGPENHHRFHETAIQYITDRGGDTSYYPSDSGDDHPSPEGNRKATAEFVPLLNVYYHRWKAGAPAQPIVQAETATAVPAETQPLVATAQPVAGNVVDDFESGPPIGSPGWQAFWDETTPTTIRCGPQGGDSHTGQAALPIVFDVAANSWATCALLYDVPQDWSTAQGLSFFVRASQPALVFEAIVYGGTPEERETYQYSLETTPEMAAGWAPVELAWPQFLRVEWEAEAGTPFAEPNRVAGVAFGFATFPDAPNTGTIWIDDLQLSGQAPAEIQQLPAAADTPAAPAVEQVQPGSEAEEQPASAGQRPRLCGAAAAFPLALAGLALLRRSRRAPLDVGNTR